VTAALAPLAVSIGSAAGVGAEVTLKALVSGARSFDAVVVGDFALIRERARSVGVDADRIVRITAAHEATGLVDRIAVLEPFAPLSEAARVAGRPSAEGGAAQLAWIDAACDLVVRGEARALVTGPASKHEIATSGVSAESARFLGHTEHLGERLGDANGPRETVMAFWSEALTISLSTTHLSIADVPRHLDAEAIARAAYWTARFVDALDVTRSLDVAVLALNPHAGEGGLLGDEEARVMAPGIALARARLAASGSTRALVGPLPAESAIRRAAHEKAYAACVAQYHDQATIPSKLLAFGDAVNVTLGLPIVRTSVDHGTAFDRAGTGTADARGMVAAMELADRLSRAGWGRDVGA
jgi:4-hydroxythreonine-4-phosphate dehydrogenase